MYLSTGAAETVGTGRMTWIGSHGYVCSSPVLLWDKPRTQA